MSSADVDVDVDVARVSVTAHEDSAFEWTNGSVNLRSRRGGAEALRAMDLLLASLAMCVAGTVRAFAKSHDIPGLEWVLVDVTGTEVGPPSRLASASIAISLEGRVSEDDAIRLRRAGAHCKIPTTLARALTCEFSDVVLDWRPFVSEEAHDSGLRGLAQGTVGR
jgi:uncharacterized OsmC-like protein